MTDLVEPDPERLPPATSPEENGSVEDEGAVVASPAYGLIGPIDALALIEARQDDPSFVILDVRTSGEFAAGYIPVRYSLTSTTANSRSTLLSWIGTVHTLSIVARGTARGGRQTSCRNSVSAASTIWRGGF